MKGKISVKVMRNAEDYLKEAMKDVNAKAGEIHARIGSIQSDAKLHMKKMLKNAKRLETLERLSR